MVKSFVQATVSAFIMTIIGFPVLTLKESHENGKTIPGTFLVPDKYYVVSMKRFPGGYLTWTTEKHSTENYRFMLLMNSVNDSNYKIGGKWYTATQWKFLETGEPGWYRLVNKCYPKEYATWRPEERYLTNGYYVILDSNYPGSHATQENFFFKPTQPKEVDMDRNQYQLKIKTLPSAVVTWNNGHHLGNPLTYYIHADNSNVQYLENHFSPGGDWFDDSIFSFVEPEDDNEKNGSVNLKYESSWVIIICYILITKIVNFTSFYTAV